MKQSFPKCNQSDMEFVISTNEKQQEEVRFLSGDFPVSVYTQHYRHAASDYVPLHWHGELQVLWIAEGALEYSVNGRHFVLGPDKLLLVNRRSSTDPGPWEGIPGPCASTLRLTFFIR